MGNDISVPSGDRSNVPEPFGPLRGHGIHFQDRGQADHSLDLATLVRIAREQYRLILGGIVLGLIMAVLITILTKPLYRADVTVEVNPPNVEVMNEEDRSNGGVANTWDFVATQAGLLGSASLAQRVAEELNLANNPAVVSQDAPPALRLRAASATVRSGLTVEVPESGTLIKFSFVSPDPQLAASIANGIADGAINSSLQRRYDASNYARNFLRRQIEKSKVDLERSERALAQYAQAEGIINTSASGGAPTDASSLQGESLIALNKALADATARRVLAEGAYRQASLSGSAEGAASTAALRQSRAALEAEYQDKATLMKPDHPDMVALKSRIDELNRQIAGERSIMAGGKTAALQAEYRAALAAESSLRSRVAGLKGSVLELRGRSIQYNILQRDVDTNRGLYDALLQRYKEIGVAGGVGAAPLSIVDRAEVPGGPFKPSLLFNLMGGLLAGLLLGGAAAIASEFLHDVIKTRDDVRQKLGLACLGVVPKRTAATNVVEDLTDVGSPIAEAYSAILAALRFSTENGAPRAILVTSAMAAEGKSSSALALAQNYARRGETVLLIDADLRRPVFKAHSNRQGLTKLLTNDEPLRAHLLDTQFENLWLLPCGPTPPNPADLLSSNRFVQVLREAGQQFDRVVIDGPPVLGLADAPLLAEMVGEVVMVVESNRTRARTAREALETLRTSGARILGVVLTKSTGEASNYGYRLYRYGTLDQPRDNIIMISHEDRE